jgi:hypothetical protein
MGQTHGPAAAKAAFVCAATEMYEELTAWRARHLEASLDEIAEQVSVRRRALMGQLLSELAEAGDGRVEAPVCEQCGETMTYKGTPVRGVVLGEGETKLARAYFHCERCERGLFPPGPATGADGARLESQDDATGGAAGGGDSVASAGGRRL